MPSEDLAATCAPLTARSTAAADADDEAMTVPVGEPAMLRLVLNEASGPSSARIERALGLLLEELGMDVAFVGELDNGARVVTHTANAPGVNLVPVGLTHPVQETPCHLFITGKAGPIVFDEGTRRACRLPPHRLVRCRCLRRVPAPGGWDGDWRPVLRRIVARAGDPRT